MPASELRELAERLCLVDPHDYEGRVITEAAAELIELIAWAEEQNALIGCSKHGAFVGWGNGRKLSGDTLIDTLRRAKEASNGRA